MEDPDGDASSGARKPRFGANRRPWWRPAGTFGRALLAFCALLVVIGVAIAFEFAKSFLEHDTRFRIEGTSNIQASGLAEVSRAEILPVFGEDIGRNIFFVPLSKRRKQLEQIPWVQHATVMRLLPDQIRISVIERQPVAFVRHGQQIGLVDANGVLLSMPAAMMAQHHYSFPVLTGIDGGDPLPSRKARIDLYLRMLGELDANGQHFSEQISEIDLTDPEDARVLMPEQGTDILAHFGEDHFLDRYQRYKAHIAEWRRQYPRLAGVDLRYDQQVVLQMAPGAATDQASVSSDGKPVESKAPETKKSAAVDHSPAKPAAAAPAPKQSARADAQHTESRPAIKHETAKAAPSKAHSAAKKENAHASAKAKAAAKTREARVKALAEKMRKERAARMKRAALDKAKQKSASKPHAAATAAQAQ